MPVQAHRFSSDRLAAIDLMTVIDRPGIAAATRIGSGRFPYDRSLKGGINRRTRHNQADHQR